MRLLKFLVFAVIILVNSCITSFESIANNIILSTVSDSLKIDNLIGEKIYYFAVESNFAAALNWAPSKNGPFIKKGHYKKISFNEISNGKPEPAYKGDRIIVYWWTDALHDYNDVFYNVIVL
jgi:hypothetical protein